MKNEHIWTIRWTQPYATDWQRPYLRGLQEQLERLIELSLEDGNFSEANEIIKKVKEL